MGRLDVQIRHGDGGPGPALAVLVIMVALAAAGSGAVAHGVTVLVHLVLITAAVLAGVAAAVGAAVVAVRRRRRRHGYTQPRTTISVRPVRGEVPPPRPQPAGRSAIEASRPPASWPLPGWWEEIRPRIGGDGDANLPR